MPVTCDHLVIGAGIVGLSIALELSKRNASAKIVVVEKEPKPGLHASGRNSGVMHSGIYYDSQTLKAKVCAAGAARMREFAKEHDIHCAHTGKVIIATSEKDLPVVERLLGNARANGIRAEKLDEQGVKALEPHASPYKVGIHSPDTFMIDSKAVIAKLTKLLTARGVTFAFGNAINSVDPETRTVSVGGQEYHYGYLFNCGGANADRIARHFGLCADYTLVPFKGMYYKLKPERAHLVRANIYPVPDIDLPFLGVHLTRVINGDVYVGPTAIPALGRENYGILKGIQLGEAVSIGSTLISMYLANQQHFRALVHTEMKKYLKSAFVASAQKLAAEIQAEDLVPCDKVGIRPQLIHTKKKALQMDYIIEQTPSSLHVLNAISPAFTSAFAFAELLVDRAHG